MCLYNFVPWYAGFALKAVYVLREQLQKQAFLV